MERKETVLSAVSEHKTAAKLYRPMLITKIAGQIFDMLVNCFPATDYEDCLLILDIVRNSVLAVKTREGTS